MFAFEQTRRPVSTSEALRILRRAWQRHWGTIARSLRRCGPESHYSGKVPGVSSHRERSYSVVKERGPFSGSESSNLRCLPLNYLERLIV